MSMLPPVGWADVATKHDLDVRFDAADKRIDDLHNVLHGDITRIEERMTSFEARLGSLKLWMFGTAITVILFVAGSVGTATGFILDAIGDAQVTNQQPPPSP